MYNAYAHFSAHITYTCARFIDMYESVLLAVRLRGEGPGSVMPEAT